MIFRIFSLKRSDPPLAENARERLHVPAALEVTVGVQDRARAARERGEAVELEVALEDEAIGLLPAEQLAHFPERRRPELAVVVLVAVAVEIGAGHRAVD